MRPNSDPMRHAVRSLLILVGLLLAAVPALADEPVFARCDTDSGSILIVLYPDLAPGHVANFEHLAKTDFYVGTKFHRVIPGFMIQGGDPLSTDQDPRNDGMGAPMIRDVLDGKGQQVYEDALARLNERLEAQGFKPIDAIEARANLKAEFTDRVSHLRGTLSMARGGHDIDSAGSQFFICVADVPHLDGSYSIFGFVVEGMDVADRIVSGEPRRGAGQGAVRNPATIEKVTILEGTDDLTAAEKAAWEALPAERKNVK